jgi:hypothetical protein
MIGNSLTKRLARNGKQGLAMQCQSSRLRLYHSGEPGW